MIFFVWVGFIIVIILQFYGWGEIVYYDFFFDCICVWNFFDVFYIVIFCVMIIFFVVVIILWCYYIIYKIVKVSVQWMQGYVVKSNV